jgi:hypothetical protein
MTPLEEYYNSMSEKERKACEIARSHLGYLFDLEKTAGFLQWKKKQEEKKSNSAASAKTG